MDDSKPANRERKLASRRRARRYPNSGRGYLHAMTNSRVRRAARRLRKWKARTGDAQAPEPGPTSRDPDARDPR